MSTSTSSLSKRRAAATTKQLSSSQKMMKKSPHRSLGSLLCHFVGQTMAVECKNGTIYQGLLTNIDDTMNLSLQEASRLTTITAKDTSNKKRKRPDSLEGRDSRPKTDDSQSVSPHLLSIVSIRGSTIRYIHFPSNLDLASTIQQGLDRQRAAKQKYQRGVRKK